MTVGSLRRRGEASPCFLPPLRHRPEAILCCSIPLTRFHGPSGSPRRCGITDVSPRASKTHVAGAGLGNSTAQLQANFSPEGHCVKCGLRQGREEGRKDVSVFGHESWERSGARNRAGRAIVQWLATKKNGLTKLKAASRTVGLLCPTLDSPNLDSFFYPRIQSPPLFVIPPWPLVKG